MNRLPRRPPSVQVPLRGRLAADPSVDQSVLIIMRQRPSAASSRTATFYCSPPSIGTDNDDPDLSLRLSKLWIGVAALIVGITALVVVGRLL